MADGVLLTETLTGEVATSDTGKLFGNFGLIDNVVDGAGVLQELNHNPINLTAPLDGQVGVVAEFSTTIINGLRYPVWTGKQIISNGADFGDDGLITGLDGESTKPDLNAKTVKTFCHVGVDPIGFEKQ